MLSLYARPGSFFTPSTLMEGFIGLSVVFTSFNTSSSVLLSNVADPYNPFCPSSGAPARDKGTTTDPLFAEKIFCT